MAWRRRRSAAEMASALALALVRGLAPVSGSQSLSGGLHRGVAWEHKTDVVVVVAAVVVVVVVIGWRWLRLEPGSGRRRERRGESCHHEEREESRCGHDHALGGCGGRGRGNASGEVSPVCCVCLVYAARSRVVLFAQGG